ncbi:MAG: TolB family protein, partial [Candidatus Saccharimonadales bacterium]
MAAYSFLEALLRLPSVYQPLVSPDGRWIAWSWFHKDDRANIYLVPTDGSRRPVRLTDSSEDMFVVSWDADNKSLIVECCDDGNERMRLYDGFSALPEGTRSVKPRSLTKQRWRGIRRRDLAKAENFFWQSADGLNM